MADDVVPFDPNRPALDKLRKQEMVKASSFVEPFMYSETSLVAERSVAEQVRKISAYLRKAALPLKAHFSHGEREKPSLANLPLPLGVTSGKQLAGIQKCDLSYCAVKLNDQTEKTVLLKSPSKLAAYHQMMLDRVVSYIDRRELKGYEDRPSNQPIYAKMFGGAESFKKRYPACYQFFEQGFWTGAKPGAGCAITDSYLREELVAFGPPDKLQPILRISEAFEISTPANPIFVEIDIYTNHYFDSSARVYEVLPYGTDKSIVVINDILEIDELKKSGLIRFLYKGQMESAVSDYQSTFASNLN